MEKAVKVAQLKGEKSFPIGEKVKGSAVLTEQGEFFFTPAGKIDPENFNGMKLLVQKEESLGSWSVCHSKEKVSLRLTVPKVQKKTMEDAIRNLSFLQLCWFIENFK